jgi:transposase
LGIRISNGAVHEVIDRISEAIRPHDAALEDVARRAEVNCIDETSWVRNGALMWIWTKVSTTVAFSWSIPGAPRRPSRPGSRI